MYVKSYYGFIGYNNIDHECDHALGGAGVPTALNLLLADKDAGAN